VIPGGGEDRVIFIRHGHHTLRGFTVDGPPDRPAGHRDILLYAQGSETIRGVTGLCRGHRNQFRYNLVYGNAGVRLGGDGDRDGVPHAADATPRG
jgi:hypothetical protein